MADMDLTRTQLKKAWDSGRVICITAIENHVRFVYAKGDADGYLIDGKGQIRYFDSNHLAWKFVDELKGNEPAPY